MVIEKNIMPVNMLKNSRNMVKDQVSVWKSQSKEILQNMELNFFSKRCLKKKNNFLSALDLHFHIKHASPF